MKTLKTTLMLSLILLGATLFSTTKAQAQKSTPPKLTDPEIASVAVTANKLDIGWAKIAMKKSKNKAVREFAKTMINDHQNIINQAVALCTKLHVTPKDNGVSQSLVKGSKAFVKKLNPKSGMAFDKAYVDHEVAYHKAVINDVKNVLIPQTKNAQLKALLQKVVPILETHLHHAEMTQKELK